ncbi:DUF1223 domain-containing protein [Parvibaculum sp.]|uniref:DUF1223 domain-containing protein n=1 Tax=Parvibaculum sp. TaxID=2024848 RepID=UPI0032999762
MSLLRLTFRCAAFVTVLLALATLPLRAESGPVVVELFTSQGCSSCPPADAYLRELVAQDDVIALSYNVGYWDYLGWKDTLASPAHAERQRAYARTLGLSGVYTPQIVVNGVAEGVGSKRDEIGAAIEAASALPVGISFTDKGEALTLDVEAGEAPEKPATLWLIRYAKEARVEIGRGENRGRTIAYAHAVRELTPVGMWTGERMTMTLPKSDLLTRGFEGCVALLQAGDGGAILGAARTGSN